MIAARGLVKQFGSGRTAVRAIDGVDLDVAAGELLLVMGPSGSGKTTLLSLLGGLLHPTAGSVTVGGRELSALGERDLPAARQELIGFVFQRFNLLSALTAAENVAIALNLAGVRGAAAIERAQAMLSELRMAGRLDALPAVLSGGEQQRVAIGRALINDPPVILADEPTANLDSEHGREIAGLLRAIAHERGRAVVVVSHDERIAAFADRRIRLVDGRRDNGHSSRQAIGDG